MHIFITATHLSTKQGYQHVAEVNAVGYQPSEILTEPISFHEK